MDLTALDMIVLLLVLGAAAMGLWRGFVTEVLSLFAWVAIVAARSDRHGLGRGGGGVRADRRGHLSGRTAGRERDREADADLDPGAGRPRAGFRLRRGEGVDPR